MSFGSVVACVRERGQVEIWDGEPCQAASSQEARPRQVYTGAMWLVAGAVVMACVVAVVTVATMVVGVAFCAMQRTRRRAPLEPPPPFFV